MTGSAAAPAARCRKFRRGSFIFEPPSLVSLFDHLIGTQQKWRRDRQAKRPCGFQIDCQLVSSRQLYREFTWICSTQDAVNVRRTPARLFHLVNSIRDQATTFGEITERIDSRQIELARQGNNKFAPESSDWTRGHNKPTIWLPRKCL